MVCDPRNGPHLSAMGMSAQLEVDAGILSLLQMVGLVVHDDGVFRVVGLAEDLGGSLAVEVHAVVAPNDAQVASHLASVAQQTDASILVELLCLRLSAEEFVVAQTGIDGCLDAMELVSHPLLDEWSHTHVDDIASDEHIVGLFAVDDVNPAAQLGPGIVIAYVQVAEHHQSQGPFEGLLCGQRQLYALLVSILDVAQHEDDKQADSDGDGGIDILMEHGLGHQSDDASQVEHQEDDDHVEQDEEGAVANVVHQLSYPQRHAVGGATKIKEGHHEADDANADEHHSPQTRQRHESPHMPTNIGEGQEGQCEE